MPKMGGSAGVKSLSEDVILAEIRLLKQNKPQEAGEQDDLFDMMDMVLWELKGGQERAEREKKISRYFRKCSVWHKPMKRVWKENIWPWLKGK